MKNILVVID